MPIAVTAYSGEQLDRRGALDITDLAKTTPDVTLKASRGTNTTLTAFIRGVGQQDPVAGFEQGVGLYLDDVYLNRPQAAVLDIYDVERIEVLRGPQGTLYGRNTIGGAIKYVTTPIPTDGPHFSVRTNVGTHGQFDAIVSASTPLTDTLRSALRRRGSATRGFGKNLTTGQRNYNKDIWAARGTLEFQPSARSSSACPATIPGTTATHAAGTVSSRTCARQLPAGIRCTCLPGARQCLRYPGWPQRPEAGVRSGGVALYRRVRLNDWLKFRTITAYRKDTSHTPIDFDATPFVDLDVPAIYRNHQFSQELQLVVDKGPLQGVGGFYYLNADAFDVFDVRLYTSAANLGLTAATLRRREDEDLGRLRRFHL